MAVSSVKFGIEIKDGAHNVRTEDVEKAVKDLVSSLLYFAHAFGVSGVTVTVTRGGCDD